MINIRFPNSDYAAVEMNDEAAQTACLSTHLTLQNSPILFGCRTGICGTCLVTATGDMQLPGPEEQEVLEILAPECENARLACQIKPTGDITLTPLTL